MVGRGLGIGPDATSAETWDTGQLGNSASGSHKFTTRGTFTYHCSNHSFMHGTVVVQ
jgi:plastocyanin